MDHLDPVRVQESIAMIVGSLLSVLCVGVVFPVFGPYVLVRLLAWRTHEFSSSGGTDGE